MKKRVAVLVSGDGTNLQALLDAAKAGNMPHAELVLVVSSKPNAFAIQRAVQAGVAAQVVGPDEFAGRTEHDQALLRILRQHSIDVVVLAGWLCILGNQVLQAFPDRILNVHPSLLPSFGGEGFYGLRVHKAALDRGVKITGATVHLVNKVVDGGRILLQKPVLVQPDDTPESLQQRVMQQAEWVLLPQAVEMICAGAVSE